MLLKLIFFLLFASSAAVLELSGAKRGCKTKCGNVTIPYPFGIGVECAQNRGLYITCNNYSASSAKPYIEDGNMEIVGITSTEVRIRNSLEFRCYNRSGVANQSSVAYDGNENWMDLKESLYTFSDKSNRFISVGCNTIAFIQGHEMEQYTSGCISICTSKKRVLTGSCSGIGCCQTSIPKGLKYFETYIRRPYDDWIPETLAYSPCSYAFVADQNMFTFHASDISDLSFFNRTQNVPVVLDWVIENITCKVAKRNLSSYACKMNTDCNDSDNGPGYRCSCKLGYEGNPYLPSGCQDIDECKDPNQNECLSLNNCVNQQGSYSCTCPRGTHGDGKKHREGCVPESKKFPVALVTLGFGLGLLSLLVGSCWLYFGLKKRSVARQKEKFFKQNGGLLLQQHQIASHEGGAVKLTRIYTEDELNEATNNYNESRILGQGGYGTVYKGIFPRDRLIVAIKKSKLVVETQIEQFINEVVILTQINHRNVVKLLGCCLETEVPLLVYEYISNGTLYEHIHKKVLGGFWSKLSWPNRLRIATETAGALSYLHSAASIPIIHRDVKSANILLDDNYNAKVADFGASRLIPLDQTQISTLVQGTMGYLDPEYFQTSQLTEKSDVYSFGVVLVELITGEKPLSFERSEARRNLATSFILSMRENALLQIVEEDLVDDDSGKEQLFAVAGLAMKCLDLRGEVRPTMREVVGELESLQRIGQHPWAEVSKEETTYLLNESFDLYPVASNTSGQYSMNDSMMLPLNLPR